MDWGDSVTFTVVAEGPEPLAYQWFLGTNAIAGETNTSLTLPGVDYSQQGDYSVQVTAPVGLFTLSTNATLTRSQPCQLASRHPHRTSAGLHPPGTALPTTSTQELKWPKSRPLRAEPSSNWTATTPPPHSPSWVPLACQDTGRLLSRSLASADDDSVGDWFYWQSGHPSNRPPNGAPFIDLTYAPRPTPFTQQPENPLCGSRNHHPAGKPPVWTFGIASVLSGATLRVVASEGATAAFHNVLLAACGAAAAGATNFAAITAEHITADVTNLWTGAQPDRIALTNSIVVGTIATGPTVATDHCAINPTGPVFQASGLGHYYLPADSPFHQAGTTNSSPRLRAEFHRKTTAPPLDFPPYMTIAGDMTLLPQAPRYTNGAPDIGFWYDALDYTTPTLVLSAGTLTVTPGTAVGIPNQYVSDYDAFTMIGFWVQQGASFVSRGMPDRPNTFTATKFVQETPATDFSQYQLFWGIPFGTVSFVADYEPVDDTTPAPTLDFRFSNFYLSPPDYQYWSGLSEDQNWITSPDSSVSWTMRDCALHGGRVNLGFPDYLDFGESAIFAPGQVTWVNNLFDHVSVSLTPTFYWDVAVANSDIQVQAYNNLFRGGWWFILEPNPASAGNWLFRDNILDKVDVWQDTGPTPRRRITMAAGHCPPRSWRSAGRVKPTAW